jgi:3-phosphoshikimate 1-carboxyvinyltransferase
MKYTTSHSQLNGTVHIPGSKSHTIRAVAIASLAHGTSTIRQPLLSEDASSARKGYSQLGAEITGDDALWSVKGCGGALQTPAETIDVGNSGTSLRMLAGSVALISGTATLTGDYQIQRRPNAPLVKALRNLGATVEAADERGCAPLTITGPFSGGTTEVDCLSSQYVSALLLNAPLAEGDTVINVVNPNELPYIDMTLWWLDQQGIRYERDGYKQFTVFGNQQYNAFDKAIPADWSSATFFLCAGALCRGSITLEGLDLSDPQGDKDVIGYLKSMGANIAIDGNTVTVSHSDLHGATIDMNATPDALPAMAVTATFASSPTTLTNVKQARIKETDRIDVMTKNLRSLGIKIDEHEDGMTIYPGPLQSGSVGGFDDHRIVMSMAIAGLAAPEGVSIEVDRAEAAKVTFPEFAQFVTQLGGNLTISY